MHIKNAFKVLVSNVNLIYKTMLYRIICFSLIALFAYIFVIPGLREITRSPEMAKLIDESLNVLKNIFSIGSGGAFDNQALPDAFNAFRGMIASKIDAVYMAITFFVVLGLILRFLWLIGDYTACAVLDRYMSSIARFGFIPTLFANLGKAAIYALFFTAVTFVIDIIVIFISVVIFVYGMRYISVFSLLVAIAFVITAFAFKKTFFSRFLPAMVNGNNLKGCFKSYLPGKRAFGELMGTFSFAILLLIYLNISIAVFTVLSGLIISIPCSALLFTCINCVEFYHSETRKYYIDYDNIVVPKEKRSEEEQLLKCL